MATAALDPLRPIFRAPREGRAYDMPTMRAVFKADGAETANRFSVSEWWLAPHSIGPGRHSHAANDELFLVIEGTASILVGDDWLEAPKGAFVMIPAGVEHDFENRTGERMGLFNVFLPGGFEQNMPAIVDWFRDHPSA